MFSSTVGTTTLASPLLDATAKDILVPFSQIGVMRPCWHTYQILIFLLRLFLLHILIYQPKKKKNPQLFPFSNNAKMQLCVPVLPNAQELKGYFLIFLFSHMLALLPEGYLYSSFWWYSLALLQWNVNSEMPDSLESSKTSRTSSESHCNKRLVKNWECTYTIHFFLKQWIEEFVSYSDFFFFLQFSSEAVSGWNQYHSYSRNTFFKEHLCHHWLSWFFITKN